MSSERVQVILDFLGYVRAEEVSAEMLHSKYFYELPDTNNKSAHYAQSLLVLSFLKQELITDPKIDLYPYEEAFGKIQNVYRTDQDQENIFVIILNQDLPTEKRIYCVMSGDQIRSLSVLRKGDRIIGWN